jgi:hypothetical protein
MIAPLSGNVAAVILDIRMHNGEHSRHKNIHTVSGQGVQKSGISDMMCRQSIRAALTIIQKDQDYNGLV